MCPKHANGFSFCPKISQHHYQDLPISIPPSQTHRSDFISPSLQTGLLGSSHVCLILIVQARQTHSHLSSPKCMLPPLRCSSLANINHSFLSNRQRQTFWPGRFGWHVESPYNRVGSNLPSQGLQKAWRLITQLSDRGLNN